MIPLGLRLIAEVSLSDSLNIDNLSKINVMLKNKLTTEEFFLEFCWGRVYKSKICSYPKAYLFHGKVFSVFQNL